MCRADASDGRGPSGHKPDGDGMCYAEQCDTRCENTIVSEWAYHRLDDKETIGNDDFDDSVG